MMREELIGLLDRITAKFRFDAWENTDKIADFLIANGISIPVRCKDCKRRNTVLCPVESSWEDYPWKNTEDNDYCSYGERRKENGR